MKRSNIVILTIAVVIILDQIIKFWVKMNMSIGEDIPILGLSWAYIHFVENPGMAFGFELGGSTGKLLLSLFRIIAVGFLFYLIRSLIKSEAPKGLLFCFALITAGAIGNIIDSAFYGLIFSASPYHSGVAEFLPEAGGYAGFLYGKVVDMFYFPMYRGNLPEWVPFWGGEYFEFFRPVFNLADSSITVGVASILLFQRQYFGKEDEIQDETKDDKNEEEGMMNDDSLPVPD